MKSGTAVLAFLTLAACGGGATVTQHPDPRPGVTLTQIAIDDANSYLVAGEEGAFLVDAGFPASTGALLAALRGEGHPPEALGAVVITHGHADHAGAAARLQSLGVTVVAGAADAPLLAGEEAALCPTSPLARMVAATLPERPASPVVPDVGVEAPMSLEELTRIDAAVIPLPGHTPGSVVVTVGDAVLVGDLVRGRIFGRGPARHFFMCDLGDNDEDLAALLDAIATDARLVLPGHFDAFAAADLAAFLGRTLEEETTP